MIKEYDFNYSEWIDIRVELPPEGKYVLVRHNRGNRISEDQENVNCVVAMIDMGMSMEDRNKLDPDSDEARTFRSADEHGNNKRPYCFDVFGPGSFNGQEIICWMPIEPLNLK